jgi:hypothetical protein
MIKIDTSDDTVADFWVAGSDYFVRIEGTTVDGATINAVVAHFSIENRVTALVRKILANKAVQNKLTGVITYYDDDDVTPILTITPTDDGSLITRTPS